MVRALWPQEDPDFQQRNNNAFGMRSVVKILLIINIGAFVADHLFSFAGFPPLYIFLGLDCTHFMTWTAPLRVYELITYQFLHGDLMHVGFNMLMLWFFGRELERALGSRRFLSLYLICGVVGGLIQIFIGQILINMIKGGGHSLAPVVGASGAIYGILIYYALKWPNRTVIFIVVYMKARTMALIFIGISVLYGLFPTDGGDRVAHFCHLGGALCGFLFYRNQGWLQNFKESVKVRQVQKKEMKEAEKEHEMDRLLNKIHEEGINSLTDSERKFLNEASKTYKK